MSFTDSFFGLLYYNTELFIFLQLLCATLYFFLFRKYIYSIFDPMLLVVISLCFGTADVLFMHLLGRVSSYYFWNYTFTQTMFFTGFLLIRPVKILTPEKTQTWRESHKGKIIIILLYYTASLTFIFSQIVSFFYFGTGLLQESRLMLYSEGGGGGILGRIIPVTSAITIFLLMDRFFSTGKQNCVAKGYDILTFLMVLVSLFATGSKSSLLNLIYIVFFYCFFFSRFREFADTVQKLRKFQARFFVFAFLGAIGIIFIGFLNTIEEVRINPLNALGQRFILSGDVFMAAYPEDALSSIEWSNPLTVIFSDLLGFLRIVPYDQLPKALGLQLYRYFDDSNLIKGPNPVHNVFGLFYFGYFGSLIYSFLIGIITSAIRNKLILVLPKSKLGGLLFMLISQPMLGICTDISYSFSLMNNLLFVGLPLITFSVILGQMISVIIHSPGTKFLKLEAQSFAR